MKKAMKKTSCKGECTKAKKAAKKLGKGTTRRSKNY